MAIHEAGTSGLDRQEIVAQVPEVLRVSRPPAEVLDLWFGRARAGGYIALGSRRPFRDGSPAAPRFATIIPVSRTQLIFPQFIAHDLQYTKYIGTNTLNRKALHEIRREGVPVSEEEYEVALEKRKPRYFHFANHHVRELCSIFVDLDFGKSSGLNTHSAEDALVSVFARSVFGHIPRPSMLAKSGTGAYALWLLREHENSQYPPLVTDQNEHYWRLITNDLFNKVDDLIPDEKARRLAQWCKAPGTIDTKTGNKVEYWVPFVGDEVTGESKIPLYSLAELVEFFGIPTADIDEAVEIGAYQKWKGVKTPDLPSSKKPKTGEPPIGKDGKRKDPEAPQRARYRDIESVAIARNKIRPGMRWTFCSYYFWSVWGAYSTIHERPDAYKRARERLYEFNQKYCDPPMPWDSVKKLILSPYRQFARVETVVRALKITRDEAEGLALKSLIPASLKTEREEKRMAKIKGWRSRKELLEKLIREGKTNDQIYRLTADHEPSIEKWDICRARKRLGIDDPAVKSEKQEKMKH